MDIVTVGLVQVNIGWDYERREAGEPGVQPSEHYASTYILPYSVALLQAYAQRRAPRPERYRFLPPIHRRMPVEAAVRHLLPADVVAFSAYVWSERLSLAVARRLKELRPETLVVFGGPQVPDAAEGFLREKGQVDIVAHGEGEAVFLDLLERVPARDWSGLAGVSYLEGDVFRTQPRRARIKDLSELPSPFLDGTFDALMIANPATRWYVVWETNRGCPFACTFCDWGSAVNSKVYTFDLARLHSEIDWMARHRIEHVYCADANFGILPRDQEIAEYAVKSRRLCGYPASLNVQSTKNATERAWRIQQLLASAMPTIGVTVSFQSLDPHALKMVRRENISSRTFEELQRRYARAGIPTYTDLILGLPGETYTSFADGIDRLITGGQHDRVMFHNCSVLPNAEMAQPAYRERHGIETVLQPILNSHAALETREEVEELLPVVVATAAMPPEEWARAKALSWMVDLLYFNRLLQIPLTLLASTYETGYRGLFEALSAADPGEFPILAGVQAEFLAKARDIQAGGEEYCPSAEWLGIWWPSDELALVRLAAEGRLSQLYSEVERLLVVHLFERDVPVDPFLLHDAVELNQELFTLPFRERPVVLTLSHDVWGYFRGVVTGQRVPLAARVTRYVIPRKRSWSSWSDWALHIATQQYRKQAYLETPHELTSTAPTRPDSEAPGEPKSAERLAGQRRRGEAGQ